LLLDICVGVWFRLMGCFSQIKPSYNELLKYNSPEDTCGAVSARLEPDVVSDTCGVVTARLEPDVVSENRLNITLQPSSDNVNEGI